MSSPIKDVYVAPAKPRLMRMSANGSEADLNPCVTSRPISKAVARFISTVGSNPTLSANTLPSACPGSGAMSAFRSFSSLPDLRCKQRTEPVPPEPYCLVADVDATFEQQILDLSQRQGKPDIHHHRKPDDRGRTVEIAEGILHRCKLWNTTSQLKLICSDTASAINAGKANRLGRGAAWDRAM